MTAGSLRILGADPRWCTDPARGEPSSIRPKSRSSTTEHPHSPAPLTNRIPAPWRAMGTPATSMATTLCKGRASSAPRSRTWCSTRTASLLPAALERRRRARSKALLRPSFSPGCDRKVRRDGKDSEEAFPEPIKQPSFLSFCPFSLSFCPFSLSFCPSLFLPPFLSLSLIFFLSFSLSLAPLFFPNDCILVLYGGKLLHL